LEDKVAGKSALNLDCVLFIPFEVVWEQLVIDRAEAELEACCSAPVSINDAFSCCWGIASLSKKMLFGCGRGLFQVNEELVEFRW
jgi:hypothetical protein